MAEWVVRRALVQECGDLDPDQVLFKTITLTTLSWVAWEHQKYSIIFSILQKRPRPCASCTLPPQHKGAVIEKEHHENVNCFQREKEIYGLSFRPDINLNLTGSPKPQDGSVRSVTAAFQSHQVSVLASLLQAGL